MTISQSPATRPHFTGAHEIDVELFTFIEWHATNVACWDVLIFFRQNLSQQPDALEISKRIGRATRTVRKELDDLVYLGALRAERNQGSIRYTLARTPATRRAVVRLARDFAPRA